MPRYWVFFDTETFDVPRDNGTHEMRLQMGWALYWDREEDSHEWFFFTDSQSFWWFVDTKMPEKEQLNLMAHNTAFDLSVVKWIHNLFDNGWSRGSKVIIPSGGSPIPFHVAFKKNQHTINLRDLANYYGMQSLANIGRSVGIAKMDVVNYREEPERWFNALPGSDDWQTLRAYCQRDVEVVWKAMRVYMSFLVNHDLGPLAMSTASQAKQAFTRLMPTANGKGVIAYHDEPRRLRLERESYMGGRVEIFGRRGFMAGPFREYDFNSMYPSVQLTELYPVMAVRGGWGYCNKPGQATKAVTHERVESWIARDFCVVARVEVNIPAAHTPHLPMKYEGKLIFPTGEFITVLTTPELLFALERGYVRKVLEYSLYHGRRDLFAPYMNFFYGQRLDYKREGNNAFQQLCKLFMNSLYGKFGQYRHEWVKSDLPAEIFDKTLSMTINEIRYRCFAGVVEARSKEKEEPPESFAAISAHVTAYGRELLRNAIEVVGRLDELAPGEGVVYCDTDSLHVRGAVHERLHAAGLVDPDRLGALKFEDHNGDGSPTGWMAFIAPKDYSGENRATKTKGIKKDAIEVQKGEWAQSQFRGFAGAMRDNDLDTAVRRTIVKRRSNKYLKAHEMSDGRIVPLHFMDGRPADSSKYGEMYG